MRKNGVEVNPEKRTHHKRLSDRFPLPTAQFRRRAWLDFQRALDPLSPPKPLRIERRD